LSVPSTLDLAALALEMKAAQENVRQIQPLRNDVPMSTHRRDFDKVAASWDEEPTRVKLANDIFSALIQQVRLTPEMEVLDFGCGTGLVSLSIAPLVKSVTGADSSEGMLEVFKAKAIRQGQANASALLLDPDRSDFPPGPYDVIISSMTFHHGSPDPLLAQMFGASSHPPACVWPTWTSTRESSTRTTRVCFILDSTGPKCIVPL
jgi:2-polyprenyl-3-methyl-5-hydroxy-6-metoxy-1,4-benzoquinol methylase